MSTAPHPGNANDPLLQEALVRFDALLQQAAELEASEPNAMTIATSDLAGRSTARTVLMKQFDRDGLTFFSSDHGVKGQQLAVNPRACAVFHWRTLAQQVIVEGPIHHLSTKESDSYWQTRSRQSQLAAWASRQSHALSSRDDLLMRVEQLADEYANRDIPRPSYWHGFVLDATRIEFWQAGDARLNHRDSYERSKTGWHLQLLSP